MQVFFTKYIFLSFFHLKFSPTQNLDSSQYYSSLGGVYSQLWYKSWVCLNEVENMGRTKIRSVAVVPTADDAGVC